MNFRDTAPPQDQPTAINWRKRVQEYLETIPFAHPADDLELFTAISLGDKPGTAIRANRANVLMQATINDYGKVSLLGQYAMMAELIARAVRA